MKRIILLVVSLIFIITAYSENKGFSRWSFAPEYGYNKFDGDIISENIQVLPTSLQQITYGANLEYALTPIWGFALEYSYFPLKAKNKYNTIRINTDLYSTGLNLTINLTRLLFPQTKSKIYINGGVGLGYSYYNFNSASPSLGVNLNNGNAYSIPITLSLEYNVSRTISLGSKVQYRAFNKDDLEGVSTLNYKGNSNDYIGAGTLFLRYKFNSAKKDHLRNIRQDVYSPNLGLEISKSNAEKINKLDNVISKLEEIVNYQNTLIDSMNVLLTNIRYSTEGQDMLDMRGFEPNKSQNASSGNKGKLLKINVDTSSSKENIDAVPAVYFDYDKIDLDEKALDAISQIAIKIKANPGLYVEIRGYGDNLENEKNNNQLSQRRSDRVKAELVNYWKIPYNRILTNVKGLITEHPLKNRPNRRCDIFFVKL